MKKRFVWCAVAVLFCLSLLAGCGGNTGTSVPSPDQAENQTPPSQSLDNSGNTSPGQNEQPVSGSEDPGELPKVFLTTDLSADGLVAVYEALDASPTGNIAVKLSTGEPGSNYLRTDLIGPLVQSFENPTIVECNTAYGGQRANTAMHYQVAEDHGYTAIADVDIMDEEGSMTLPVIGGTNLTENYVGSHFANYDYYVILSHFKGHAMAGYGGAIKNISIGIASSDGKTHIHTAGQGGQYVECPPGPLLRIHGRGGEVCGRLLGRQHPLYQCDEPFERGL